LNDAFASVIAVGLRSAISRAQARASSMFRLAQQLSVVDHAVHEPPAERFFRVERLAGLTRGSNHRTAAGVRPSERQSEA